MIDMLEWWRIGHENGWIDDSTFCYTHDGPPITEQEEAEIDEADGDPDVVCVPCVRIYPFGKPVDEKNTTGENRNGTDR